jgi:hypothetical protein
VKVARITGLLAILMGLIPSGELAAGPINPAKKVKTKIIFSEIKGEHRPVIGVISSKEVVVLLKDEQRKRTRPKQVRAVEKQLPPVGRVTICSTEGLSEWENSVMGGWVTNYTQTSFAFDMVADREIRNAYIALFYEFPENRSSGIAFCSLGDLPAGELVHREAFFPNVKLPRGTSYRFTIYAEGMPVEKFRLNRVATLPRSQGLLIPWGIRLKHYIEKAQANGTSRMPNPFDVGFTHLDKSQIKDRGIESAKVGILVHVDGRVSLEKGDGQLSEEDLKQLSRDISGWRFFPALKEGEPYERRVSIPLQF